MNFLKKFFRKELDKADKEILYKKISPQEFLDYSESHKEEKYTQRDTNGIKSVFDRQISGQNTPTCFTIGRKILGGMDEFFIIEKFKDEWFVTHRCRMDSSEKNGFRTLESYLCDTVEGVKDCIRRFIYYFQK